MRDIDHGFKRIVKELGKVKNAPYVKVGVLSDAPAYEEGGNANLADVATWNEFGTSTSPSRPFMAQTFDMNEPETRAFIEKEEAKVIQGKQSQEQALNSIGVFYQGKIRLTFVKGSFVKNADSTILKKRSSRPLIHIGHLREQINFEVKMDGGE